MTEWPMVVFHINMRERVSRHYTHDLFIKLCPAFCLQIRQFLNAMRRGVHLQAEVCF